MWIIGTFFSNSSYPSSEILYVHKGIIAPPPMGAGWDTVLFGSQALKEGQRKQGAWQSK